VLFRSGPVLYGAVLERDYCGDASAGSDPQRLLGLFKSAPVAMALVQKDGTISGSNMAFGKCFGAAKMLGKASLFDLTNDETLKDGLHQAIEKAVARKVAIPPVDITIAEAKRTIRLFVSPLPRGAQSDEVAMVFGIDTSEQRLLEEQIAQSQKMQAIGQLAGGIAHDFNNVLTAIIGFSDLLLTNHRPTDPAFADIMNIKNNANRAAGLVRHLLAFSRKQTLRPQVLSLTDALEDLMHLLAQLLGEKVKARMVHGRDLWFVKVDPTQFQQVIINLAVNARDAMPGGGELTIRTANVSERESAALTHAGLEPGEYVLCEVSDTGTGIPPEIIDKIFEPFFSTKEVGKGTGLGLSTVYGIVKQTGGNILCDSDVGSGTIFRIFLPRCAEEVADIGENAEKPAKKEAAKDLTGSATVLLVEDEDAVRSFAARALTTRGYNVLTAISGVQALDVMSEHGGEVDLVISDVVMPEMDGPTLMKHLRKANPQMKIIFMSGYAEEAFRNNLDEDEKFSFLPKPFTLKKLAAIVKETLDGE
jgi:two-component system, cell cycle sensor histidine kinase and response regulator CckA